jgi:gas vesicle protein
MSNSKTLTTLLIGLSIGAAAGILLAPHSGAKTRKKIRKAGADFLGDVKEKAEEVGQQIKDKFSSAKDDLSGSL